MSLTGESALKLVVVVLFVFLVGSLAVGIAFDAASLTGTIAAFAVLLVVVTLLPIRFVGLIDRVF